MGKGWSAGKGPQDNGSGGQQDDFGGQQSDISPRHGQRNNQGQGQNIQLQQQANRTGIASITNRVVIKYMMQRWQDKSPSHQNHSNQGPPRMGFGHRIESANQ